MTRRTWLQRGAITLAGCNQSQAKVTVLRAGAFAVTVPERWARTAIIEKVPLMPLYTSEGWRAYQADKKYQSKPGYICRPQHWALRFPSAEVPSRTFNAEMAGDNATAPQILIHKADEWGLAFTDGIHHEQKATEVVQRLRADLEAWRAKDLPHGSPGYMDAELHFICLKTPLRFTGGQGIRMVCQWKTEADFVQRGELHYLFLGLSADNTCQIIATFPLDLPGLPDGGIEADHLGWSKKRYGELERDSERYEKEAKRWIEHHANDFKPSLQVLDGIMQSLVVNHWQ